MLFTQWSTIMPLRKINVQVDATSEHDVKQTWFLLYGKKLAK